MYLMLSVAGHLTIFQTRTRGPWWSTRPAWILLAAVVGTQAVATIISVYGAWLVTPIGWKYSGIVWGYAFAWFLVTDPVKLLAYKVLDTANRTPHPNLRRKPRPSRTPGRNKALSQRRDRARSQSRGKPATKAEATPDVGADNAKPGLSPTPKARRKSKPLQDRRPPGQTPRPATPSRTPKPDPSSKPKPRPSLKPRLNPSREGSPEPNPNLKPNPASKRCSTHRSATSFWPASSNPGGCRTHHSGGYHQG